MSRTMSGIPQSSGGDVKLDGDNEFTGTNTYNTNRPTSNLTTTPANTDLITKQNADALYSNNTGDVTLAGNNIFTGTNTYNTNRPTSNLITAPANTDLITKQNADGLYIGLTGNETISGTKTFNEFIKKSGSGASLTPQDASQLTPKQYVDDTINSKINPTVYDSIKNLCPQLNSFASIMTLDYITSNSSSGIDNAGWSFGQQQTIENAHATFHVMAIFGYDRGTGEPGFAEDLPGIGAPAGKVIIPSRYFSGGFPPPNPNFRFIYSDPTPTGLTPPDILSTGLTMSPFTGTTSGDQTFTIADNKKWMAMALYDVEDDNDRCFKGIIVWLFRGKMSTSSGTNTYVKIINNIRDIFYPTPSNTAFNMIDYLVFDNEGTQIKNQFTGFGVPNDPDECGCGWNYSSGQAATIAGYYSTTKFSNDDGAWGVRAGSAVDGNSSQTSFGQIEFGAINPNQSSDVGKGYYWDGDYNNREWVAYLFTGDA